MKIIEKLLLMGSLCLLINAKAFANSIKVNSDTTKINLSNDKNYQPINFNLTLKNMHLWRGYRVTSGAMTAVNLNYQSKNEKFKAGIWGGAGFDGKYKEFDYYLGYKIGHLSADLWDINNFSDFPNATIFDYTRNRTSHFIDLTIGYDFQTPIPFKLSWSTILQGRDTYTNENLQIKNAYSNFISLNVPIYQNKDSQLDVFTSYAFSFASRKNFYSSKPNFVEIGISYNKNAEIFNFSLPIGARAMWNPEIGYGGIQLSIKFL